jgi:PIN domain nuclease of toxin-antitoxin system
MKLLLDTHIFLWIITGDARLNASHQQALRDPKNSVFLSVVSIWEATIKSDLGRLPLPQLPGAYLPEQRERHGIESLALDERSVAQLATLPDLHRDPFNRMLV